jgi:hypothetical protein
MGGSPTAPERVYNGGGQTSGGPPRGPTRTGGRGMHDQIDEQTMRRKLEEMRLEHRALDEAIVRLSGDPTMDQVQLRRLKKRKLQLKDFISRIESLLIPDLNA